MSIVLDASVIVALVVQDQRQSTVQGLLERWIDTGEELHAPAVLPYEVTNVLARRIFSGDLTVDEVVGIWADIADLGIEFHAFDLVVDGPAVAGITARLRRRHATDSTYVWLAQQLGTHMWTLDAALARSAGDVGLPVELIA